MFTLFGVSLMKNSSSKTILSERADDRLVLRPRIILGCSLKTTIHVGERVGAEEGERETVCANVCVITLTDHTIHRQHILNYSPKLQKKSQKSASIFCFYFSG